MRARPISVSGAAGVVRRYAGSDERAVLELVEADRLAGQPEVTAEMLAEALAGRSIVDAGWWLELDPPCTDVLVGSGVEPNHRGKGLARPLLNQAVGLLAEQGAREVILFVDDDEPPGGDRDRSAANHLYDSSGFVEVDRLYSYTTTP